ncbi:hypothetical protein [Desulfosarcina widdelii]|nr:hypothetical protein [Desulfosarcina widdelii]
MKKFFFSSLVIVFGLLVSISIVHAETFIDTTHDSRVIVAFKVAEKTVQPWLPDGWSVVPFGKGPLAGSNLLVVFHDRHLILDPEGKPSAIPHFRDVALATLASQANSDKIRMYATRVYATDSSLNPYKNSVSAMISRTSELSAEGNAAASGSEEWTVKTSDGGTLSFRMKYIGNTPSYGESESFIYSNVEPDFYRIYRQKHLTELVKSVSAKVDRTTEHAFSTTIPEMASMFDGSEELIGILNVPIYWRQTYLP